MYKCGQFRTMETVHSQYKGTVSCPSVETVPNEQWLEEMKKKKIVYTWSQRHRH